MDLTTANPLGFFYKEGIRIRKKDEVNNEKQDFGCLRSSLYGF